MTVRERARVRRRTETARVTVLRRRGIRTARRLVANQQ